LRPALQVNASVLQARLGEEVIAQAWRGHIGQGEVLGRCGFTNSAIGSALPVPRLPRNRFAWASEQHGLLDSPNAFVRPPALARSHAVVVSTSRHQLRAWAALRGIVAPASSPSAAKEISTWVEAPSTAVQCAEKRRLGEQVSWVGSNHPQLPRNKRPTKKTMV